MMWHACKGDWLLSKMEGPKAWINMDLGNSMFQESDNWRKPKLCPALQWFFLWTWNHPVMPEVCSFGRFAKLTPQSFSGSPEFLFVAMVSMVITDWMTVLPLFCWPSESNIMETTGFRQEAYLWNEQVWYLWALVPKSKSPPSGLTTK